MNIPHEYKFWRYPLLLKLRFWLTTVFYKNTVCVKYWINANTFAWTPRIGHYNWGDYINLKLAELISGKTVIPSKYVSMSPKVAMMGSILPWAMDKHTIVWGSGCLDSKDKDWQFVENPLKICAVRGPLSRKVLIEHNIDCPEVYGDPALCFPRFYLPEMQKTHKIGIIPHASNIKGGWPKGVEIPNNAIIINPCAFSKWNEFIDQIVSCEIIFSASLHGIIISDAYGIPNVWVSFPNHTHPDNNFKFHDYFLSVGKGNIKNPIDIKNIDFLEVEKYIKNWIAPKFDIDKLLSVCPLC